MEIYLVICPLIKTPFVFDSLEKAQELFNEFKKDLSENFEIIEEKEFSFCYKFNDTKKEIFIYKTQVK